MSIIIATHKNLLSSFSEIFSLRFRPTIFDPSELRTDVTGKVVRYLQDNGAPVEAGEPYVEVEAMKMIMPIKASESGKITHSLSAGSVISAGDLLASLELKDPSKVKKIVTFEGDLDTAGSELEVDPSEAVKNILAGFNGDPEATVPLAFEAIDNAQAAIILRQLAQCLCIATCACGCFGMNEGQGLGVGIACQHRFNLSDINSASPFIGDHDRLSTAARFSSSVSQVITSSRSFCVGW